MMESQARRRGRPVGSGKKPATERRLRKDYRLSPAALRQIEQGRQLAHTSATAFVEAAISHYIEALTGQTEAAKVAQPALQGQEEVGAPVSAAITPAQPRPSRPRPERKPQQISPPAPPSGEFPSSLRQPVYQIFLRHEPGSAHPGLPAGFTYMDQHKSIQPEQCPTHRVFARPCAIAVARRQAEQLKAVPGVVAFWILDRSGQTKDSWHKDQQGRWVKND